MDSVPPTTKKLFLVTQPHSCITCPCGCDVSDRRGSNHLVWCLHTGLPGSFHQAGELQVFKNVEKLFHLSTTTLALHVLHPPHTDPGLYHPSKPRPPIYSPTAQPTHSSLICRTRLPLGYQHLIPPPPSPLSPFRPPPQPIQQSQPSQSPSTRMISTSPFDTPQLIVNRIRINECRPLGRNDIDLSKI